MDGGGRLSGSVVSGSFSRSISHEKSIDSGALVQTRRLLKPRRQSERHFAERMPRGAGSVLTIAFLGLCALAGLVQGGQYAAWRSSLGDPRDALARMLGFGVTRITMTGQAELHEHEILTASGVDARHSLLFLAICC
jgi:cell division protein FtsQ